MTHFSTIWLILRLFESLRGSVLLDLTLSSLCEVIEIQPSCAG